MSEEFWMGEAPAPEAPTSFGEIPVGIEPAAGVAARWKLARWKD